MTQDELDRWEALANAATPGPWVLVDRDILGGYEVHAPDDWTVFGYNGPERTDAAFIAAARDAVPALIAEVRRLRGLVEAAYCEGYRDRHDKGDTELMDVEWARSDARHALEGA